MDHQATGFVLRTRLLTETSLIAHWLTADYGRIATAAKGARRPSSPFRGKLDLFYSADFSFARSRRSDLHTLREVRLREVHPALRQDLQRLRQASYGAALIELTTEAETPLPEIFGLFARLLEYLSRESTQPLVVCAFELRLLDELGLTPPWPESRLTLGAKQILEQLNQPGWPGLRALKPSAAQAEEIAGFLQHFLLHQFGRVPRSRETALSKQVI